MIELINSIFEEKGFKKKEDSLEGQKYYFSTRKSESNFDFFVIIDQDNKELNIEMFNEWSSLLIDKLISENPIPGIDKNLSMIILLKSDSETDDKEFQKVISEIEEDPYYFKKNILTYTKEQEKKLTSLVLNKSIVNEIENYVGNKQQFYEFKKNSANLIELNSNLYNLISKIFIKLPFLSVPIKKETLSNLSDKIREQINDKDASYLNISLKSIPDTVEVQEILDGIGVK